MTINIQEGSNVFNRKMVEKKYNKEKGFKNKWGTQRKKKKQNKMEMKQK